MFASLAEHTVFIFKIKQLCQFNVFVLRFLIFTVTDTYAHGFDADRKLIAQEMDSGFFAKVSDMNKITETDEI